MPNRSDMVNAGKDALALGVKYVYGAKPAKVDGLWRFQRYNEDEIDNLRDIYGSDCVWWSDSNKAGQLCCDCSGLITKGCGVMHGSGQFKAESETVSLSHLWDNWEECIGYALWLPGHIGIVSEEYGYYYAMDGSARNAVHNPMSAQGWQCALKLPFVDYSEPYGEEDEVKQEDIDKIVEATAKRVREYLVDQRAFNGPCIIEPYGHGIQVYFDGGSKLVKLTHPDQREALFQAFNAELPTFVMGGENAPWFSRLMQACGYGSADEIPEANADAWL